MKFEGLETDVKMEILNVAGQRVFETKVTERGDVEEAIRIKRCLLYTSPSPRDRTRSRMPSSAWKKKRKKKK